MLDSLAQFSREFAFSMLKSRREVICLPQGPKRNSQEEAKQACGQYLILLLYMTGIQTFGLFVQ